MDQKNWLAKSFSLSEQPYRSVRTSLVAGLFVCGKSVLAGTAGFRVVVGADPYKVTRSFRKNFLKASGYTPNSKIIFMKVLWFEVTTPSKYKNQNVVIEEDQEI